MVHGGVAVSDRGERRRQHHPPDTSLVGGTQNTKRTVARGDDEVVLIARAPFRERGGDVQYVRAAGHGRRPARSWVRSASTISTDASCAPPLRVPDLRRTLRASHGRPHPVSGFWQLQDAVGTQEPSPSGDQKGVVAHCFSPFRYLLALRLLPRSGRIHRRPWPPVLRPAFRGRAQRRRAVPPGTGPSRCRRRGLPRRLPYPSRGQGAGPRSTGPLRAGCRVRRASRPVHGAHSPSMEAIGRTPVDVHARLLVALASEVALIERVRGSRVSEARAGVQAMLRGD